MGLIAAAPFLATIWFSRGGVQGADLTSRGVAFSAVSYAAVLEGMLSLLDDFGCQGVERIEQFAGAEKTRLVF